MAQTVNEALIELASDISGEDLSGKYGTTTVDGFNALIEALDGDMSMKDSVADVIADFGVALKAALNIEDSNDEPDTPTEPETPTETDPDAPAETGAE